MKTFETESIDLAAFLTAAGNPPTVYLKPNASRALFEFTETEELREAIVSYERGAALPAKKLLTTRSALYREASRVVREGGGR
ncbi:DUF5659 domain-containing protein [Geobacter sp. DSM 9736]|uniref:DUF5659 domain-containing protein n=1 Tax=Geobacter sp. DSM 9736 TaxID=1277350 RepID=UPI000B512B5A|nr:DUF5659 domain-containing protein [Geobacter sp. DSM 9736]SNB45936.1 hypothetical protein SAMN06269301_1370 [Geobacter sp. DSM 9736]